MGVSCTCYLLCLWSSKDNLLESVFSTLWVSGIKSAPQVGRQQVPLPAEPPHWPAHLVLTFIPRSPYAISYHFPIVKALLT